MEIILKKQPQKYLAAVDTNTRKKLYKALDKLLILEGDIVKLKGEQNTYRLKIEHYRVLFEYDSKRGEIIIVSTINTRSNIKY
jgi:mRNA-degrading endonuclease RelE of RelBE toxin-antitoxin system